MPFDHFYTDLQLPNEEWRDIDGFIGAYQVSSFGRVRNTGLLKYRGAGSARILRPNIHKSGYSAHTLGMRGSGRTFMTHRLVAEAFLGPMSGGLQTAHMDGDRSNNRADNLAYCSAKENTGHKNRHGTMVRGEAASIAKLTEHKVRVARERIARGETYLAVGRDMGVTAGAIWNACHSTWRSVS